MKKIKGVSEQLISIGRYAIRTKESGWITEKQIETCRRTMTRTGARVFPRIKAYVDFTKKPVGTRMGKGKGSFDHKSAPVKPGQILYELDGVSESIAKEAARLMDAKLNIKTRFEVFK